MSYEICKHIINNFSVEKQKKTILEFIKDETNPYEQRLEIWRKTPAALCVVENWIWHHPDFDDDDWMKYDWWNRCQEIDLVDIAEYHDWDEETTKKFYNGCMKAGIWGFKFDW